MIESHSGISERPDLDTSVPAARTSAHIVEELATSTIWAPGDVSNRQAVGGTAPSMALIVAPTETVSKKMCSAVSFSVLTWIMPYSTA